MTPRASGRGVRIYDNRSASTDFVGEWSKYMASDHHQGNYRHTLYDPAFEHDACGTGFVSDVSGRPSHRVVQMAIEAVVNLTHRGAVAADMKTGDGAGILTPLPRRLLVEEAARLGKTVSGDDLAAGMVFFPRDAARQARARQIIEEAVTAESLEAIAWRIVPVDPSSLGKKAFAERPHIEQLLIGRPAGIDAAEFERRLYHARKQIELHASEEQIDDVYLPSFSSRTIVYKGLFVAPQLAHFYRDLVDPAYEAELAIFHQHYSTNTFPNWFLAQPFRMLAHNGEINTIQGNRNWMRAREPSLTSPVWGDRIQGIFPTVWAHGSDSASIDNVLELIELS